MFNRKVRKNYFVILQRFSVTKYLLAVMFRFTISSFSRSSSSKMKAPVKKQYFKNAFNMANE